MSRLIYRAAFVNILGVGLLVYFERTGIISPPDLASNERFIIISILIVFTAILQKRIIHSWEQAVDDSHESERRIRDAYVLTLEGWAKTLEFHDRETLGHSQRVTVTGDAPCKASDKTYRIDTESAWSFLSNFVALP